MGHLKVRGDEKSFKITSKISPPPIKKAVIDKEQPKLFQEAAQKSQNLFEIKGNPPVSCEKTRTFGELTKKQGHNLFNVINVAPINLENIFENPYNTALKY